MEQRGPPAASRSRRDPAGHGPSTAGESSYIYNKFPSEIAAEFAAYMVVDVMLG
jgi:hypothetical protein